MTEAPKEGTPTPTTPDYQKAIEELKAMNVALVEKISKLEEQNKSFDEKMTALSGAAQKAAQENVKKTYESSKSALDAAYEKAMAELGLTKKE